MKKFCYAFTLAAVLLFCGCSTNSDLEDDNTANTIEQVDQTVIMFMPWSTNLLSYLKQNIADMETALIEMAPTQQRVFVCLANSASTAYLYELKYKSGACVHDTIQTYIAPDFTQSSEITAMLRTVAEAAPANRYGMIVGCHGFGWIPVSTTQSAGTIGIQCDRFHWEYTDGPLTRWYGGGSAQYQADISTLANGIKNADMHMEYILFDDCYMSSIEVAYDLKDATDYLVGCPTEVMGPGYPYDLIGKYLVGDFNYEAVVDGFYNYYLTYTYGGKTYPYGTIGVTQTSELDALALVMREINSRYDSENVDTDEIQDMDGYTPTIFFDMLSYVRELCEDDALLAQFEAQLERTVPCKAHTPYYYSSSSGRKYISTFGGVTISDPTVNNSSTYNYPKQTKYDTAWYAATH